MNFRRRLPFLLLLLLAPVSAARAQPAAVKGPDFSGRGGPFAVLGGLNFHRVERIEYVGGDRAAAYGVEVDAEKFLVGAWVNVPKYDVPVIIADAEDNSYQRVESRLAEFEVWVGRDADDRIHDEMLKGVHGFWTANKPGWFSRSGRVEASEHLNYKAGRYLLFRVLNQPVHYLAPFARRVVWADGKVVWFRFKRFVPGGGSNPRPPFDPDAAVDDFLGAHFSVLSGRVRLHALPMKGSFRKEFFRQYEKGTFRGSV